MGSGSGGGGGGGSGGASAGGGQGYGGYRIRGGRIFVDDVDEAKKEKGLKKVLGKLRPEYLHEQFIDSSARDIYRELSLLRVDLAVNRDWSGIAGRLGVEGGAGCMRRLAAALMRRFEASDHNKKSRAFIRKALENFLYSIVRDDSQLFDSGTAQGVINNVDATVFDHLSEIFLGDLLYEVIRGEERALPEEVQDGLRDIVQKKALQVVDKFIAHFGRKPFEDIKQVSYRHLFDVMASEEDWFWNQLRG